MEIVLLTSELRVDWESAYAEHARGLAAYLLRMVHDTEGAADLVHDTFIEAIRAENDLRDRDKLRPWLYRIATRAAYRHLRRRRVLRLVRLAEAEGLNVAAADAIDLQVHSALAAIGTDQASALLLHHQQGFTRREIAQVAGVSEEAVKSRLARGRANFIAAYRRLERGLAR